MAENRWVVVAGALMVQLCLGAIYSWSVFVKPLKDGYKYTTTETQMIFSVALATFAVVMIFAGRWQDRRGPRTVATVGGFLLGIGYILASLTDGSFPLMVLTVGVVGGAGIGFGYVCPIASCVKWFPDKRGLITGLAVAGFGAGAWLFQQLASSMIAEYGLMAAFRFLGLIFLVVVVAGAQLLRNPPQGWVCAGWKPSQQSRKLPATDWEWRQMAGSSQFWMLWVMFVFGASAGLMVIGILKPFGISSGLSDAVAGAAVGVLALFNGAGRIVWGTLSDKIGRSRAMAAMFCLQGLMMLGLAGMGSSELTLAIAAAWVGFNFGGNFALFPSATADYFGTKNLGVNYGLVFTSYGIAGIIGPILGGMVFDATGSYLWAFIPSGAACLVAAVLALAMKPPLRK
jgi:MFS transporter, OFA family, oxalate/formate antiporter